MAENTPTDDDRLAALGYRQELRRSLSDSW